jgi:transcriptional regulator with XRE-family HTH domain
MRKQNVIPFRRPRSFTTAEAFMEDVQELIHADKRSLKVIAEATGVGASTIGNIATGKTRWPRHTTLFPLLGALGYNLGLGKE